MIGETISHYRIVEPLREEGIEDAYKAQDLVGGQKVVLKLLPNPVDADSLPRFRDRIRAMAAQKHPGKTVVLDVLNDRGRCFLVLASQHAVELLMHPMGIDEEGDPGSTAQFTRPISRSALSAGQILGDRYRILSQIGRGGMGDVWHAFDLKLQLEVALKSLRRELFEDTKALELLRSEVRTARGVVSPNVCRIFDLVVEDGQELVSMEYIDGQTLTELLEKQATLGLGEAQTIAAQFLAGLEAIHAAGLVHRDIKPENMMITRSGRVVVMDFGIAKGVTADASSTVSGTPAYMAPEQLRGENLDARADIFAAGIVLAEMAAGARDRAARERIWKGVREALPRLPDGPWRAVLERAVAPERERRPNSAGALARALEEVTLRVDGAEDKRPYPGLAAFTEADREYFYGREAEVESVWKKLQRTSLLAIAGPSGAGKTSFVQAGLLPSMPEGWHSVLCHPGTAPLKALAQSLVPELSNDTEAMRSLVDFDDPDVAVRLFLRWRQRHKAVLLIVDQFEELFTLNRPEVQSQVGKLLERLVHDADVHVLLSMRDDFLFRCHEHDSLSAVFEGITPLGPPTGAALRRAIVQPALSCGYRFEDESLVNALLEEVGEERGSLPLVAFTVGRLWERRDRDSGTLTRRAYEEIGGVGGALAQHAEVTLERIGAARQSMVREILRNLATSQGTRAARDTEDLLSLFGDRNAAGEVLQQLVEARLLTTFDVPQEDVGPRPAPGATPDGQHRQRVEIVHESLLREWPRLVRWQAQETDSAVLRDQLRQAAQLWEDKGRTRDLLWTGTAYREYELWRERYGEKLPRTEAAFAQAMTQREKRRKRIRGVTITASFLVLLAFMALLGASRQNAVQEARRAEASRLLALGQNALPGNPTHALAYAIASLELEDDPQTRQFALRVVQTEPLSHRPPAQWTNPEERPGYVGLPRFSPDGRWLASGRWGKGARLWPRDGGPYLDVGEQEKDPTYALGFSPTSDLLVTLGRGKKELQFWSIPDGALLRSVDLEGRSDGYVVSSPPRVITWTQDEPKVHIQSWDLERRRPVSLGTVAPGELWSVSVDSRGRWVLFWSGENLFIQSLDRLEESTPRKIGKHDATVLAAAFDPEGKRIASADALGNVFVWSLESIDTPLLWSTQAPQSPRFLRFDPTGRFVAAAVGGGGDNGRMWIWDLSASPKADPIQFGLYGDDMSGFYGCDFSPTGNWVGTSSTGGLALWSLAQMQSVVVARARSVYVGVACDPEQDRFLAVDNSDQAQMYPIPGGALAKGPDLSMQLAGRLAWSRSGGKIAFGLLQVGFVDLDSKEITILPQSTDVSSSWLRTVAIDTEGKFVAAAGGPNLSGETRIRIWDLASNTFQDQYVDETTIWDLCFMPDGRLLSAGYSSGLRLWDLQQGTSKTLDPDGMLHVAIDTQGRYVAAVTWPYGTQLHGEVRFREITTEHFEELAAHGDEVVSVALDPLGELVATGDTRGIIRVGPVSGEKVHLLIGHDTAIGAIAFTPDGKRLLSLGGPIIRSWRLPVGEPLHGLDSSAFIAGLKAFTNVRMEQDETAPDGYRVGIFPFTGWVNEPGWSAASAP